MSFPDCFLDYLPEPRGGADGWWRELEEAFPKDAPGPPPIHALLKVTDRCASGCVYCSHARGATLTPDPTNEELRGVIRELAEAGACSLNVSGGEPLQRDDLFDLVAVARDAGLAPVLLTNGALLASRIRELEAQPPDLVIVSVDSLRSDAYRTTRGIRLDPVLAGIDAVLALGDAGPALTVTAVITEENVNELPAMVEHFSARGVGVQVTPHHHYGPKAEDHTSPRDRTRLEQAVAALAAQKDAGCGVVNSRTYLEQIPAWAFERHALPVGYRCLAGYAAIYVDAALNVRPCWSQGLPVSGNLRKTRLASILAGRSMRKARGRIRRLDCDRCWMLCTAEVSLRWDR